MPDSLPTASAPSVGRPGSRPGGGLPSPYAEPVHRAAFLAFLGLTVLNSGGALVGAGGSAAWSWVHGCHIALAAFTMLAALARWLPVQNVVVCGLVLSVTSGMVLALSAKTGFPLGEFRFNATLGPRVLDLVAWPVPFLWVAVLLASRQTAKVVLLPWRRNRHYGWWLLGAATGLALIQTMALEPYGHRVAGWWSWPKGEHAFTWFGAPPALFAGTVLLSLALLLLAAPWLVPKRRTGRTPDFEPVWVWLGLLAWFGLGDLRAGLWLAGVLAVLAGGAVGWLAWRGAHVNLTPPK